MKFALFNLGVSDELEYYLQDKVRFSNLLSLILAVCGLSFSILSGLQTPSLVVYPLGIFVVSLLTLLLNYFRLVNFSRLLLTVMIPLLFFLYHGFLVPPDVSMIGQVFVLQFVLVFIPWVMFDFRESLFLFFVLIVCCVLLLVQSFGNELLESGLQKSDYDISAIENMAGIFAFTILLAAMLMFVFQNQKYEHKIADLESSIEEGQRALESQQSELYQTLNEVNLARKEEAKRNWINEGLANLDSLLRGNYTEEIYHKLISFIVKHLKVNQGGIFLAEQDDDGNTYLNLAGCYAFDRRKFLEKKMDKDEGLIGQVYMEKETVLLCDIPSNYINITSGLGDASPKCLLIVPMKNDNTIDGVIELASFHNLESHEIEFVEKAGVHIASFVEDFRFNYKTQVLLEKNQIQAEEMRAQEEEMKQTLEEMQSIQEEMYRKEKEYINRIADLEEVIAKEKARIAELKKYQ